jgi:hypothetical protein
LGVLTKDDDAIPDINAWAKTLVLDQVQFDYRNGVVTDTMAEFERRYSIAQCRV